MTNKQLPEKMKIDTKRDSPEYVSTAIVINAILDYFAPQEEKKPCCPLDHPHSPNGCLSKPTPHTETEIEKVAKKVAFYAHPDTRDLVENACLIALSSTVLSALQRVEMTVGENEKDPNMELETYGRNQERSRFRAILQAEKGKCNKK